MSDQNCTICGKRLVLPDGSLACACGALAAEPACTHPDVWDFEHSDGMMGMNGTDHTIECAQDHVDRALQVWGMDGEVRWVVDSIEVHPGGVHEGEHHEPFTVAYGYYDGASDE